jgi:hypothetical protein
MTIRIQMVRRLYQADTTPPHGGNTPWSSPEPMSRESLVQLLLSSGCHQTDIGDAFYEADPEWLLRGQGE